MRNRETMAVLGCLLLLTFVVLGLGLGLGVSALSQDGLYLYRWKVSLEDPDGSLWSWNSRDSTPCKWAGVRCNNSSSVTSVELPSSNLAGPFVPSLLCWLPKLSSIVLSNNSINGSLPLEISLCSSLTHLDLSQNLLSGALPGTLPLIPRLLHLDLTANSFSGPIPHSFGTFPSLQVLSLVYNLLDHTLPPSLFNVTTLTTLSLSYNPFLPSPLPPSFSAPSGSPNATSKAKSPPPFALVFLING